MAKKQKKEREAGKHPGTIARQQQDQSGRPTTERRQNEVPSLPEDEQQQFGDRFPRGSYEVDRERKKEF